MSTKIVELEHILWGSLSSGLYFQLTLGLVELIDAAFEDYQSGTSLKVIVEGMRNEF